MAIADEALKCLRAVSQPDAVLGEMQRLWAEAAAAPFDKHPELADRLYGIAEAPGLG
jgi:hypothetical protein